MKETKQRQYAQPLITKPKQYTMDAAMLMAIKRAKVQPELISMNSHIRIWEERGT